MTLLARGLSIVLAALLLLAGADSPALAQPAQKPKIRVWLLRTAGRRRRTSSP